MPVKKNLQARVIETIRHFRLFEKGEHILVACSGGADSVCLLYILQDMQSEWSLRLSVAHFNHGLRPDADQDEQFVKNLAKNFGLRFFGKKENVREYARSRRLNLEEAGRERRYAFLKNTAAQLSPAQIATAHTRNDQAETFLMRLLRGTGRRGLAGILPAAGDGNGLGAEFSPGFSPSQRIVRPLIHVERKDIEAFLAQRRIPFHEDSSNLDKRIFRNKLRLELMPELQQNYSPQIVTHLSRLADMLREEEELLEALVQEKSAMLIAEREEGLGLDLDRMQQHPPALQRRLVREFLRRLRGDLRGISFSDSDELLALGEGREWHVESGLIIKNEKGFLCFKKSVPPVKPYSYTWQPDRSLNIPELGIGFVGEKFRKSKPLPLDFDDRIRAFLDRNKLRFPLTVRSRREGDRYQPLGAPGRNKLKEIMRSRGVAPSNRDRFPVFVSGQEIVWVLGLPVSEKFKVGDDTSEVFLIRKVSLS